MKKNYILILSFLLFAVAGCKNVDEGHLKQQLIGEWDAPLSFIPGQEGSGGLNYVVNFKFNNNSQFETITSVYDEKSDFLGYIGFSEGSFRVDDKDLQLNYFTIYQIDEANYVDTVDELVSPNNLVNQMEQIEQFRMDFNTDFNVLTLYSNCPENAFCTPDPVLERASKSAF